MQRTNHQERLAEREQQLKSLLLAGLAGDAASYRAFLTALAGHLRAFLGRRLIGRPAEVEDVVQEVLLAVHNARHSYLPGQPVTAWVQAIGRYKLADYLRTARRVQDRQLPLDDQAEWFAETDDQATEASRDLGRLLSQLPDRQRLPIEYVKLEGLSVDETAHKVGQSISAVKVNIHRGLKSLAKMIRGERNDEH
ncbi:sigma-70 family RNA polymerase sigma factor [Pseudomonas asplenii]|uniref:RNA polymerase sigma factor, sigma-70 family n=1 Tax=Pseudomonas asplenii TaxID=53407 RepID=A0A0N0E1G8_9PSED|nr:MULTISPECIES: sigma-70 family RNA polymerase sigma factor [Pseudomonas]KPA87666.1 RNA polymerase sigma factor, sigma-70 family [Pseudomonas fuscovaginae]KPA99130.1 RNA polymerase, sigma subunit, ECF family [Pseudomonas fuscovaginae]